MNDEKGRRDLALLEAYISGVLTPEQKSMVESRFQTDESFMRLFETLKHLGSAARLSHLSRKRDELLDLEQKIREEE